jgi:hypothetical protein
MSEYWVSHKKYYCKYCETYIAEDAPSRAQHENGLRHKGNKERFVRNLYKQSEKKKHDAEEERREMARVDQVRSARSPAPALRDSRHAMHRPRAQRSRRTSRLGARRRAPARCLRRRRRNLRHLQRRSRRALGRTTRARPHSGSPTPTRSARRPRPSASARRAPSACGRSSPRPRPPAEKTGRTA